LLARTAGIGHHSLFAMEHLGYVKAFKAVGFTTDQTKIALGLIGARIEATDSERGTIQWLQHCSALGALGDMIGINFNTKSVMILLRIRDLLYENKSNIEKHIVDFTKN
jgi:hypothetical protein